jgi:hypothetical protein
LWYRLVKVNCSRDQSYWLYTKRSADAGWRPAFTSIGSPVPVSVRQADDGHFEVVLEAPLADGRATVPLIFDQDGSIRELQQFDHGSPSGHP